MKDLLFSTFFTSKEVLHWELPSPTLAMALVDAAYDQWLEEDRELAEYYADCWTGYIEVRPRGYAVRLETESTRTRINISHEMVERARELMADLRSIGKEIDALGVDEWPVIVHLDAQANINLEALANEYMALLVNAGLVVEPLVKETE